MKHIANIMRINNCNPDQESTVGRIFAQGRGKAKKHLILWLNGWEEEHGANYYDACAAARNANTWNFIERI